MTWTEQRQLSPAGSAYSTHHYRANGPYDPDAALGGGLPRHWNFVKQGWKKYVVLGSRITAKFLPTTQQDTAIPGVFWLHRSNLSTSPYDGLSDARADGIRIVSTGPTEKSKFAAATFSLKKVTGNKYASADDTYHSLTTGLPTAQQYFHLTASSIGSDTPASMFFLVTIEYIVKFFDNNPDDGDSL